MQISILLVALFVSGCAQMFTAKTTARYTSPDGRTVEYTSDKEQNNLDARFNPATGEFHIMVDKATTQESVVAATLMMNMKILDMLVQQLSTASKAAPMSMTGVRGPGATTIERDAPAYKYQPEGKKSGIAAPEFLECGLWLQQCQRERYIPERVSLQ